MDRQPLLDGIDRRDWHEVGDGTVWFARVDLGGWTSWQVVPATGASEAGETTVVVSGDRSKARVTVDAVEPIHTGGGSRPSWPGPGTTPPVEVS